METDKRTGLDRKVEILQGVADKARTFSRLAQLKHAEGYNVQELISQEEYNELVKIGTSQQEFDAALAGVGFSKSE